MYDHCETSIVHSNGALAWPAAATDPVASRRVLHAAAALTLLLASPSPVVADTITARWTTLGTNSGPIPNSERMEPANLLQYGDQTVLVDAGDGAAEQLTKAGVALASLHVVVLSHLHFDHTAGLFAVIALRHQMLAPGTLTIYGPPGIQATVAGLLAAMMPSPPAGPKSAAPAAASISVIEIGDGAAFHIGAIAVRAVANSHYVATPGGEKFVSLSFRFEVPGRSIVYTGDTGPSSGVVELAKNADLLISEIMDADGAFRRLRRDRPDVPDAAWAQVRKHFEQEHMLPVAVGLMAQAANVKALVLTHNATAPSESAALRPGIASNYHGPISFARDLDSF